MAKSAKKAPGKDSTDDRVDVVWIRVSSDTQDETGQINNVTKMLAEKSIQVPDDLWFHGSVVKRHKVSGNKSFQRLLEMVSANKVGTIYIETQDRFGTDDVAEFFATILEFRLHGTKLFDLRDKVDLTGRGDYALTRGFLGAIKSTKEREDLAFRSMRTKLDHFAVTGSWPTGLHPFGFGKQCYTADGKTLLWEWQPTRVIRIKKVGRTKGERRTVGQLFKPNKNGKLKLFGEDEPIPKREPKLNLIVKLVPSNNKFWVQTIRLIFSLFTKFGLSRHQISARLNKEGRKFYDKPFEHRQVTYILSNPAYVGDTHYGKSKCARHFSFNPETNLPEKIEMPQGKERRDESERIVMKNTHKGLISRHVWDLAQARLKDEQERTCYSPRNPNYFLKPILVCGHCGKNMTGSTKTNQGEKTVVYVCQSYKAATSNGQEVSCGAYQIAHAHAEQLLKAKINELNLDVDEVASMSGQKALVKQADSVRGKAEDEFLLEHDLIEESVQALKSYYHQGDIPVPKSYGRFCQMARQSYDLLAYRSRRNRPTKEFRELVVKLENESVEQAEAKVAELTRKIERLTDLMADAGPVQRESIKQKCASLEAEIAQWQGRTQPISQQIKDVRKRGHELGREWSRLVDELPGLESREKGEAYRRVFKKVTLYWDKRFVARSDKPRRPHTTDRKGRNKFTLLKNKIAWELSVPNLDDRW